MNSLLLYCRAGFEKELAAEITEKSSALGVFGFARVVENSGYLLFECYQESEADWLAQQLSIQQLIFARQMIVVSDLLSSLNPQDRITPIIEKYKNNTALDLTKSTELWVETADTNEAKELLTFCRKFTVPMRNAMKKQGWLVSNKQLKCGLTLHIFFIQPNNCYIGYSYNQHHAPYFMGILRLKFPVEAPSRSTLKLEEAIRTFIPKEKEHLHFNQEMYAVDLGACPGGWTYQLVKRGLFVYAVDHGKMASSLHETGRIEHCAEDGFKFHPPKRKKIHWLVCDMVEQPSRVITLIAKWFSYGWCKESIFNLKLPMKKRYQEVQKCLSYIETILDEKGFKVKIQAKQLYHDREEVTVHIQIM
ncbi:23S rRNA (cytidine(2498)-2'-O)-methyltransferase RlmM [Seminibacterium arietis]|uniref:Ribosomal RNA large subunit methyltransferase M n=1 Tax=Seminibacterium arietis TaxID=1173502 RepID=A0ABW3I884_9PAST